ncbi:glycoside hydrolase family 2 protein [Baekduia soli]|uniref:Glycoside hydrolase family 2 protein n=1 Tax=Baekduia soli TaxID=496014 RepID=A0A5B8U1L0_9ACTN|nr:glycoside hydrolase family 2 protein [Baekduia soli]QEC46893.1 glycoside hydrolase family 2 protein [Baekduia soli]
MPRWPDIPGHDVRRLEGFEADGPPDDACDRTFRLRFDAEPASPGEEVVLALDGVATVFTATLNGTRVAEGSSMFVGVEADVGGLLRAGGNELVIHCRALADVLAGAPRRPRQRWRTRVVADGALRFVRTAVLGRAAGFAPGPPIVGPWRPVWLVRRRGVVVSDVALRPRLEGDDGVLEIAAHVRMAGGGAVPGPVSVVVGRPEGVHAGAPLTLEADGTLHGAVRVPSVARWWPHTHGAPALHDVALVVGAMQDTTVAGLGRTGFRDLSPGPGHDVDAEGLDLAVNDVPVFARGAVWTPVPADGLRATLQTARDAGLNLVRVPGIGVYEDDAFHDLCDELGLLVWQDFMFANLDYPIADEAFRAAVVQEAEQALARVAGRPSLAVLCGNSEVEQQAAMFGADPALGRGELFGELLPALAARAGADVPYVPSAPCGGALPMQPSRGVANYFGVGGYRRPLDDARRAGVRFASECLALANLPDGPVADGEGVMRDVGAPWDFADVRDHYLALLHDVDPAALKAADRERYLALSRTAGGEVMAAVMGEWRRAASPCAGAIVLWLRDLAPGAGWGLLDHTGAPKVALAHLRRVLAPRAVWITDEGLGGLDVHVANDGPEALRARLHVALLAGGAHVVAEAEADLEVGPHAVACRNAEGVLGRFADAAYAYRFGPPAHDVVVATLRDGGTVLGQACHFPAGRPGAPVEDLGLTAVAAAPAPDGTIAVTLSAARLAYGVRLAAAGLLPSDDDLVLVPGTPQTVVLTPRGGVATGAITVTALNAAGGTAAVAPAH